MADGNEAPRTSSKPEPSNPPFLEVICKSTGKTRRFSQGTKVGFALSVINSKINDGSPLGLYIEAVKDGEEPISFGLSAVLVCYGDGWKLQTVLDSQQDPNNVKTSKEKVSKPFLTKRQVSESDVSYKYMGKILLAFVFIFLLGAVLTFALEFLPIAISFINTSM